MIRTVTLALATLLFALVLLAPSISTAQTDDNLVSVFLPMVVNPGGPKIAPTPTPPTPTPSTPTLPTPTPSTPTPPMPTPSTPTPTSLALPKQCPVQDRAKELEALDMINAERAKVGLPALTEDLRLTQAARCHALDMATNDLFSHTGSDGLTLGQRITNVGYQWSYVGEIIAARDDTCQRIMNMWMASPTHKDIILSPMATQIGLGYGFYVDGTNQHTWVMDFGRP